MTIQEGLKWAAGTDGSLATLISEPYKPVARAGDGVRLPSTQLWHRFALPPAPAATGACVEYAAWVLKRREGVKHAQKSRHDAPTKPASTARVDENPYAP